MLTLWGGFQLQLIRRIRHATILGLVHVVVLFPVLIWLDYVSRGDSTACKGIVKYILQPNIPSSLLVGTPRSQTVPSSCACQTP